MNRRRTNGHHQKLFRESPQLFIVNFLNVPLQMTVNFYQSFHNQNRFQLTDFIK